MSDTKVFVVPDLQIPYHDSKFINKMLRVVRAWKPDVICFIGDVMDFPEVSRWTKAKAGEYETTLQASLDMGNVVLKSFRRAAPEAAIHYKTGNHDERLEQYIGDFAPALRKLRSSDLGYQLGLADLGIELQRSPFLLAPGVLAVHGHERAYSSVLGKYEMERVRQYGMSVVAGHTHTPVLATVAQGFGLSQKHYWGMNVGHGMDTSRVWYTKDGHLNWCQGFGLIDVVGETSYPRLITAPGGKFNFQGKEY
jgi:predicted phosphodiesterase